MSTFSDKYNKEVVPKMMSELGIKNRNQVPRLLKIVINMGIGVKEKDSVKIHSQELAKISGQKPLITRAKKSISNFKLRAGMDIGAKVTLRHEKMYEFLERFVCVALPKIRDFRGVPVNSFDGRGNYTLGLKEQTIFPEIDHNAGGSLQGMDITFVTSAQNDDEARALLKNLGMPFANR
jgi:large subunit ribosomal protein L5